jgi:hypothetical protein
VLLHAKPCRRLSSLRKADGVAHRKAL